MAEYTCCDDCRHSKKDMREFPCTVCIYNAIDKFEKKTNADRIREMSDEELAEWILKHDTITYCHGRLNTEQLLEWLKSEAKE